MDKIKEKNNLLLIELDRLIKQQFTNLGDIVGDFLISIEVNRGVIITNPELMKHVKDLINTSATAADQLLPSQAGSLADACKAD
jgi:hypothetical protein